MPNMLGVALGLLAIGALVGVIDIVLFWAGGKEATISEAIGQWSRTWPLLPFAAGVLVNHLFKLW